MVRVWRASRGTGTRPEPAGGYRSGGNCYITKPLKPSALLNIVDYLIGDLSPVEAPSSNRCCSGTQNPEHRAQTIASKFVVCDLGSVFGLHPSAPERRSAAILASS
jgi:hypothetical protein